VLSFRNEIVLGIKSPVATPLLIAAKHCSVLGLLFFAG
jgi:hypothetical protein